MDRSILVGAAVFLAAACSVRETRTDCPCRLRVVFTDPGAAGTADLLGWDGDALFRERVRIEECRPDRERDVSRGHFVLSAWQGTKASSAEGHRVVLPPGKQFDSLYACFSDVDASIPLMESVLVGVMSQRVPGLLAWNSATKSFDSKAANDLMRPFIRKSFEF